jgi:hypothetical protein
MKGSIAAVVGPLLIGAAQVQATDGVVNWAIQRRETPNQSGRLRRRASTIQDTISNDETLGGYFVDCKIGTPSQSLTLQLDTGSSDIWVPASSAKVCKDKSSGGCDLGSCMSLAVQRFPSIC